MYALSAAELLAAWDRGSTEEPPRRALTLLALACPESPPEALAELPVGRRDARLLALRERIFGRRLAAVADCPRCGERLELAFDVDEVRTPEGGESGEPAAIELRTMGWELRFRLPNSLDLAALAAMPTVTPEPGIESARQALLARCLLSARKESGEEAAAGDLPEEVAAAVAERMAEADPQAAVLLALSCPTCEWSWQAPLDIGDFLWSEVDALAYRLLDEVHLLARAYGWREADIVALSAARRRFYLERVAAE
jgi:hypothetical protein